MTDTDGVPADADEGDVPDHDKIAERADYPDPAFDEVDPAIEDPIPDEGSEADEPELGPEEDDMLEADEAIDPEEPDEVIPPEREEPQ